ncbi:hypothetical protein GS501_08180 [Saccharibacter sp. 17.LH.SD]|uniref:Hint domain-containing protein n=1 Tax=Saccharibacter sp. 17.LH.SD TaxID=2689393 RepID=UPI0013722CF4|nr:Hint domain-containing protein [Saccharibacter sp. 17.LH.SD]MXV45015.1 hypothetical protein [Saccharibacter sp. 17.LH.SD]
MSVTWSEDTYYGFPMSKHPISGAMNTGSIYAPQNEESGSGYSGYIGVPNTAGVVSIIVPKGTELKESGGSITVTVLLNDDSYIAQTDFYEAPYRRSFQMTLNYSGYQDYYPKGSKNPVPALFFTYGNILDTGIIMEDGSTGTWDKGEGIINEPKTIKDYFTADAGNKGHFIALMPTYETSPPTSAGSTNINPGLPSETICFLAGAEIKMSEGIKIIEEVTPGDMVVTYYRGKENFQKVISVSKAHVAVLTEDDQPVCLKAHSLADHVPYKDLFLTGEHCLYLEGVLIPARMLVNGQSIVRDHSLSGYDIYHIECEEHAVICANGAYTETYLDTSRRVSRYGNIIEIGQKKWSKDAAASLVTQRDVVEPIWQEIAQRAGVGVPSYEVTYEAELSLLTERGTRIRPYRMRNGHYLFHIPSHIGNVRLMSRTSRPSDLIGPFVDDRRDLGVLVGDIQLFHGDVSSAIEIPYQEDKLPGWDVMEVSHCRWTNGVALLPLPQLVEAGVLSLHILQAGPYLPEQSGERSAA